MKRVSNITEELKKKILEFLYCNEIYNAIMIELIQNHAENLGELYINETGEVITEVLHIKNDGNSDFTNFSYTSKEGLESIGCKINELSYEKILLAGKLEAVNSILKTLGYKKSITPNIFYKLDMEKYKNVPMKFQSKIRLANLDNADLEIVKDFTASFLQAETEEEVKAITNTEKILAKMRNGVYLLEYKNNIIGMARFVGKTNNFAEITSVYIAESYRKKGFGKELIAHMIELTVREKKTPVLATSVSNIAAMRTYESMGFERQGEYAFEFLN